MNTELDMSKLMIENSPKYSFQQPKNYNITFHQDGKEVGRLDFNGPEMTFEGDMAESCRLFMQFVAQSFSGRLKEEYQRGYDAAKKEQS
jgi:hypothetical protein